MNDKSKEEELAQNLKPGDVLAIKTENGVRYIQVTHIRAPYPDVVRAILPQENQKAPGDIAKGETAFTAMVELLSALRSDPDSISVFGHATIPQSSLPFPVFRLPIRNRAGQIVYWWTWDGEGLEVSPEAGESNLPIREITSVEALKKKLAELG